MDILTLSDVSSFKSKTGSTLEEIGFLAESAEVSKPNVGYGCKGDEGNSEADVGDETGEDRTCKVFDSIPIGLKRKEGQVEFMLETPENQRYQVLLTLPLRDD